MKVSIELSPEYSEPYAIIYTDKITDSIQRTLDIFGSYESPITAFQNENDIVILQPKEIYMVRVENKYTMPFKVIIHMGTGVQKYAIIAF